jgi:hypothetical protein
MWMDRWQLDPLGLGFVVSGVVLVLAAFTVLDWFRGDIGFPSGTTFRGVHQFLTDYEAHVEAAHLSGYFSFGAAAPYFSWLGWILLIAALCAGTLAVSGVGRSHWWVRWLGAVVCATGVGLTFLALNLIVAEGNAANNANLPTYSGYLSNSAVGAWAAVAGFFAMLVGCLAPRRDR